jgi:hypothetical protein
LIPYNCFNRPLSVNRTYWPSLMLIIHTDVCGVHSRSCCRGTTP